MNTITNWGVALWSSLAGTLAMVFAFIPRLIGFLVILLVGWLVARILAKAVALMLRRIGFDSLSERIGLVQAERQLGIRINPADLLGKVVFWFVFLIFLVPAINVLDLTSVSTLLSQVISYIPNVFVAILILLLGALVANLVANLITRTFGAQRTRFGEAVVLANIARFAILGFTVLAALDQLRIAPELIQILFTAIIGSAALAFGLAFGLGGRETVHRWLASKESTLLGPSSSRTTVPPVAETPPQTRMRPESYRNVS